MVRRAACSEKRDVFRVGNTSEVFAHFGDIGDQVEAALRAEHAMCENPYVGVRHAGNLFG